MYGGVKVKSRRTKGVLTLVLTLCLLITQVTFVHAQNIEKSVNSENKAVNTPQQSGEKAEYLLKGSETQGYVAENESNAKPGSYNATTDSYTVYDEKSSEVDEVEYLKSIIDMIKEKYGGEINIKDLLEGAMRGMLDSLDPYTLYYTPEEYEAFYSDVGGNYTGIGVTMMEQDGFIVVVKVFSSSPAEKAGIFVGDKIVSVDGKSIIGVSSDEVANLIKGEEGTEVTIGIIKHGQTEVTEVVVTRAEIKINPVTYEIRDNIGYLKIDSFNSNTYIYMNEAMDAFNKNNIKKIVLDLRDNPGGDVLQSALAARYFVKEGLITKLDFKSPYSVDIEYHSDLKEKLYDVAVLVNGNTASAAEILAGAIQDTGAGKLIGTRTFGKSKVQQLYPILSPEAYVKYEELIGAKVVDAYELITRYGVIPTEDEIIGYTKITTGMYLTPNGRIIDGIGLTPDIEVDDIELVNGVYLYNIQKLQQIDKPGLGDEGLDVYNAEKILKLCGYDVDTPDMKLDEKTFQAIIKFQEDSNLFGYGVLDFTTQKALNDLFDAKTLEIDLQYAKALEVLGK